MVAATRTNVLPKNVRNGWRYLTEPAYRAARHDARLLRRHRLRVQRLVTENNGEIWELSGGRISGGPFRGMTYIREASGSAWAPKLAGTYECELNPVIDAMTARAIPLVVDIGAAEGFYAVGLARLLPQSRIVAFETEPSARKLLAQLAAANDAAGRVALHGACSPASLDAALAGRENAFIICDVEGAEAELLDPATVAALRTAWILVELHPWVEAQIANILRSRFDATHTIEEIFARQRTAADWPPSWNTGLNSEIRAACLDEMRSGLMSWLWLVPKTSG